MSRSQRGVTLIELLVSIIVMGILSTMIIGSWMMLTDAYSFTSRSNKHRDFARQAISRMSREIRDAQAPLTGTTRTAFKTLNVGEIQFFSTFNTAGASDPGSAPTLTRFILRNGTVYREKPGPDGVFGGGDDVSTALVENVVNASIGKDLFTYYYYNTSGQMVKSSGASPPSIAVVQAIGINLYVDENPGKSPNYFDVNTTVKPRNLGQF